MSLSIIIPTIGRTTLANTLVSLLGQLNANDEVILVHDGMIMSGACKTLVDTHLIPDDLFARNGNEWRCLDGKGAIYHVIQLANGPHEDWGATARNKGLTRASGDHILFIDDDDRYTPDALDTVRRAINIDPQAMFLFQMRYPHDRILWKERQLVSCNVGTPMFCFPRTFKYNKWRRSHIHDFEFIRDVVDLNPGHTLIWMQQVIALIGWRE